MKIFSQLTLLSLLTLCLRLSGQSQFYEKKFGTGADDQSHSVKQLSDGSIYLAGSSDTLSPGIFDVTLSKLDQYGNLLWTKYYNGGQNDFAFELIVLPDKSLVLAGSRQQASGLYDALVIRTGTSGVILFEKTFGDPLQDESFASVSEDGYGKLIACGYASTALSQNDVYIVKLELSCALIWENRYGGPGTDYGQRIIPASDSGYVFVADSKSFGSGSYDVWLSHIDTAGGVIWNFVSADTLENGSQGVISTMDGNYIVFGETEIAPNSPFDFYMEKVLANGTSIWKKTFGDPLNKDALFEMIELPGKNFMCTGYSNSYNHGAALDLVVFRADSAGNIEWARNYGGSGIDIGYDLVASYNGGYLVTGKTSILSNEEYYLLSLDTLGLLTSVPDFSLKNSGLALFPNPSNGAFSIIGDKGRKVDFIQVFSLSGQLLFKETTLLAGDFYHFDFRERLKKGCYLLQIHEKERSSGMLLLIK